MTDSDMKDDTMSNMVTFRTHLWRAERDDLTVGVRD